MISDPMMPDIDPSVLDFGTMDIDFGNKKDDPLNWTSQSLLDPMVSQLISHKFDDRREDEDDDMHVELELDLGDEDTPSIEIGRKDKEPNREDEDVLVSDDEKFLNLDDQGYEMAEDDLTRTRLSSAVGYLENEENAQMIENGALMVNDTGNLPFQIGDDLPDPIAAVNDVEDPRLQRDSQSPLSSVRSSVVRTFDITNIDEEEEEVFSMRQAHKAKKRKILQADADTIISQSQIKQEQVDRSAILKPLSLLARNPMLLNLMKMQHEGGFVSSVMGDGRGKGWAPELRGILSIEVVRKSGELKRKRDSSALDSNEEAHVAVTDIPQLQIPEEADVDLVDEGVTIHGNSSTQLPAEAMEPPDDDGPNPLIDDHDLDIAPRDQQRSDAETMSPARDPFDETTAPLIYPAEQGAVSMGTQHAVHLLRDRFGPPSDFSPSRQRKSNILFQEILPEDTTSKVEATKMFFEVLVLATKDVVKVEQPESQLGGPLRIRGKRGLWGTWAEKEAGGEIAQQETASLVEAIDA